MISHIPSMLIPFFLPLLSFKWDFWEIYKFKSARILIANWMLNAFKEKHLDKDKVVLIKFLYIIHI